MNNRPWTIAPENWDKCIKSLFPKWLKERGGICVYQNQTLDSSRLGDKTFVPARYEGEDGRLHDAPDEYRPHGGLPSLRQQKVDHIKLEDFEGDIQSALKCFVREEE